MTSIVELANRVVTGAPSSESADGGREKIYKCVQPVRRCMRRTWHSARTAGADVVEKVVVGIASRRKGEANVRTARLQQRRDCHGCEK